MEAHVPGPSWLYACISQGGVPPTPGTRIPGMGSTLVSIWPPLLTAIRAGCWDPPRALQLGAPNTAQGVKNLTTTTAVQV